MDNNRNTDYANTPSNEVYIWQNSSKAFSVRLNLQYPDNFRLLTCINDKTSKVKLSIHDFSRGKGDSAIDASFNLDIIDVDYLTACARKFEMPAPLFKAKIVGASVQQGGNFSGLSPSSKLSVNRTPAEFQNGRVTRQAQWYINIREGYAKANPGKNRGSYYEQGGSFRETGASRVALSDAEFLHMMENINRGIDAFIELYKQTELAKRYEGYQQNLENWRRNSGQNRYSQQRGNNANTQRSGYQNGYQQNGFNQTRQSGWQQNYGADYYGANPYDDQ